MASAHDNDPICGNCGKARSVEHYADPCGTIHGFAYCRNGDGFTSEPCDELLLAWINYRFPDVARAAAEMWKREHGHRG